MAGIKSESVADFIPESVADFVRNQQAKAGGFGLSVTEFGRGNGMVVYWLQLPGGTVFMRRENGYDACEFRGAPSEFKQQALEARETGGAFVWRSAYGADTQYRGHAG